MTENTPKKSMRDIVALCKRIGFIFQSSEIYGGLNGLWDYGPLGVELKRNVKEAWWHDMITHHDDMNTLPGAPEAFSMVGLDCSTIMHPQVWRCSGHYDLFSDEMVDCRETKARFRYDQMVGRWVSRGTDQIFATAPEGDDAPDLIERQALRHFGLRTKHADQLEWQSEITPLPKIDDLSQVLAPTAKELGTLTEPREFNLMLETHLGPVKNDKSRAFLRPETAQGIFVNFKNVMDSTRHRLPLGIAQIGKSYRNEITPRNFTFRTREFEQMEMEFFCHPDQSHQWYTYWRDRRLKWYKDLGLASGNLQVRDHTEDELSHYSTGTADVEYAFPFLPEGDYGELEGIAHRGDFDLRSHMEGKLDEKSNPLVVQLGEDGKPKYRGSGKDLHYRDNLSGEKYIPHVIEPAAGADRATLAFICEAYTVDQAPDDKGEMQERTVMKFHPRLAPIKAAVFPLVKKDGMPETAKDIYLSLKKHFNVFYDEKAAIGRRYRRQDEAGTPLCITVDGQTLEDQTVTVRDRDTMNQERVKIADLRRMIADRVE